MHVPLLALLVALLAAVVGGCGDDAPSSPAPDAAYVVGWSEAHDDRDAVRRVEGERLVRDDDELAGLVDLAAPELDTRDLLAVDLDESVLVVGSYPRCQESSRVEVDDDGSTLRFVVVEPDDEVMCAWAPLQVDVWAVPRDALEPDVHLAPGSR